MIIQTSSNQIEVTITSINREIGCVSGWKRNKRIGGITRHGAPFSVRFANGEPVKTDGIGRPHPKLVLAAASAAWLNVP